MFIQELKKILESSDTMTIKLDIADWSGKKSMEQIIRETDDFAKRFSCTAKLLKKVGPGGGNPLFSFTGTEKNLRALYKDYLGDDPSADEEFDEFFMESFHGRETYVGAHSSAEEEKSIIQSTLRNIEEKLPHSARYKSRDVDYNKRVVYWVTQESSPRESQIAADTIAHELAMQHIKGWLVKVVLRDEYRGTEDHNTPWQTAYTDHFMPEHDEEHDINPQHFKPLHSEEEFEALDKAGRHVRTTKRFNHEYGRINWIQADGTDMPVLAVWYADHNIGSAALTTKIDDLHDYLAADPYNPTKRR